MSKLLDRWSAAVREHQAILAFLAAIFVARFFLADWNSYWNDEILSVWTYGIKNDDLGEMVETLADGSIHPPLYQSVLYLWMQIFGDSETATRSLSNVYMTLAGLFLYFAVKLPWGRAIAFFSAAGFSVMSVPTEYALETRSYAQTIVLACLSSWLLLRMLFREADPAPWAARARIGHIVGLIAANTALMLTHYYNVFWLLAQAAFLAVYLVVAWPRKQWKGALLRLLVIGAVPQAIFFALWGPIFIEQYLDREEEYSVEGGGASLTPVDLLMSSIVEDNLSTRLVVLIPLCVAVLGALAWYIVSLVRSRGSGTNREGWGYSYLFAWLLLPLVVVYAVFSFAGVERYNARYFVFSIPPVTALVVIAVAIGLRWVWGRLNGSISLTGRAVTSGLAGLLIIALTLPGGYRAAIEPKEDWRGIAQGAINIVESDPEHEYFVMETSFSSRSRLDYYFERLSRDVRSDARALTREERRGDHSRLLKLLPEPGSGERLIMIFNIRTPEDFPVLLDILESRYERLSAQLDRRGHGYIVYSADPVE